MRKPVLIRILPILTSVLCLLLDACAHQNKNLPFGLEEEHSGYVPARIAVMPCQMWPDGARYRTLAMTNADANQLKAMCMEVDAYVIGGFKDQPYMRGYSPKAVEHFLAEAGQKNIMSTFGTLWRHQETDCFDCTTPPAFYTYSIKDRTDWRSWLGTYSKSVRNTDALLFPFVLYANQQEFNDRGLEVARRSAQIALLLIDTNYGYLLWSGGREAHTAKQVPVAGNVAKNVDYPSWERVYERLFVEDLWKDFPGRQVYK